MADTPDKSGSSPVKSASAPTASASRPGATTGIFIAPELYTPSPSEKKHERAGRIYEHRTKPNMDGDEGEQYKACLPLAQKLCSDFADPKKQVLSSTQRRFALAAVAIQKAGDALNKFHFELLGGHNKRANSQLVVTVKDACSSQWLIEAAVRLIEASTLTDHRVHEGILYDFPAIELFSLFNAKLAPLDSKVTCLKSLGVCEFVVLLAYAHILAKVGDRWKALALVHELHATAASWTLRPHTDAAMILGCSTELREKDMRFALASLGVKVARAIYRRHPNSVANATPVLRETFSRTFLLDDVRTFADEQCATYSKNAAAVGHWNRAWVSKEDAALNGVPPLEATARTLQHLTTCYELADADGDDFCSSIARIDCCMCLCLGGHGTVGTHINGEQVRHPHSPHRRPPPHTHPPDRC